MEAVAKHDFTATAEDELSFKKSDIVKTLDMETDKNWYKAEKDGWEGFIPANYINMKPHPWYVGAPRREDAEAMLLDPSIPQPDGAFIVRLSESTPGDFTLSVKFENNVQHFKVLRDGGGRYFLWIVKFDSINELLYYHRSSSVSRSQSIFLKDRLMTAVLKTATVMYDFEPEEEGELALKKGDIIAVVEQPDPNWWMGMIGNARGLFPSTYVRLQHV